MKIKEIFIALLAIFFISAPAYAKKDKEKSLPPGLQKKQAAGKPLPPGWQKNIKKGDTLEESIYSRGKIVVPLGKDGTISIEVEGTILKLHEKTKEIIDVLNW